MTTRTKQAPEGVEVPFEVREMPVRHARPSVQHTLDAIRAAGPKALAEGQAAVVASHSTHKSALSAASRLRRRHVDMEFVADGTDVLARPL
jgi:hypothetical protein